MTQTPEHPKPNDFTRTAADLAQRSWWRRLRPEDVYQILYMLLTGAVVLAGWNRLANPSLHLVARAGITAFILLFVPFAQRRYHNDVAALLRDIYYMLVFIFFYTETADLHVAAWGGVSFDEVIAPMDQWIFGFQPSLEFWQAAPQRWFSELMNLCYTSYYFLFILGGLAVWIQHDGGRGYSRMLHAVVLTMLTCYLIFVFFPTLGPQYRWAELHSRDNYTGYFFKYLLDSILEFGERPTGAFPSSHVALAVVFLFSFWTYARWAFYVALPFVAGLMMATVYIGVHYFVDVPAGVLVGVIGWYASEPIRWRVVRRFNLCPYSPRRITPESSRSAGRSPQN